MRVKKVRGYYQGIYTLVNKEKYLGKGNPEFKSNYERNVFRWLDLNKNCIKWQYEGFAINYYDRLQRKIRSYYPDIFAVMIDKDGKEKKFILEIKPEKNLDQPNDNYSKMMYINNTDKWKAAINYCKAHNIIFRILTEKDIF